MPASKQNPLVQVLHRGLAVQQALDISLSKDKGSSDLEGINNIFYMLVQ